MCALRCNFANILLATKEREQMEKGEREREREREGGREKNDKNSCCCMFKKSQPSIPKTFTSDFPSHMILQKSF